MTSPLFSALRNLALTGMSALGLVSCGADSLAPADIQLQLRNTSSDSVAVRGLDREMSNLVDPIEGPVAAATFGAGVIAPRAAGIVHGSDIEGFRVGADVRFFLYRISGGQARWVTSFDVPAARLTARLNRIDVPLLGLTP